MIRLVVSIRDKSELDQGLQVLPRLLIPRMTRDEMKARTKAFALRIMNMVDHLPKNQKGTVLGNQVLRSATSVAANCRAACRAGTDQRGRAAPCRESKISPEGGR